MTVKLQRQFRSAQADRMGWAWEESEWPDMTIEEARKIVADSKTAVQEGQLSNEDTGTILYARNLLIAHENAVS